MSVSAGWRCGPIPCKSYLDKGKGGLAEADRSGLPMRPRNLSGCVVAAFTLLSFGVGVKAQTLPSYVVDAQIPIASSDGFNTPQGLAVVPGETVYVADSGKHRVLQFSLGSSQTTVSFGSLLPAVQTPSGVALDGNGNLYVTDTSANRLIELSAPIGSKAAVAIIGAAVLDRPTAVASDAAGDLAVLNSGNATITVLPSGGMSSTFKTGSTVLIAPTAVAFDSLGMLYVADAGNSITPPAVYRFSASGGTGTRVTPAGYALKNVTGLALDGQQNLFVLDGAERQLIEVPVSGAAAFLIPQSNFKSPSGLALDSLGNIYVSDSGAASNTVTEFAYQNAANFGSVQVGAASGPITFNYEFYERTTVEAVRGIGGGVWDREYRKAAGETCVLRTYYPSTSSTGVTLPATCTVNFNFEPVYVGGRSGAVQLQTSNGNVNQLTIGVGMGAQLALMNAPITTRLGSIDYPAPMIVNGADTEIYFCAAGGTYKVGVAGGTPTLVTTQKGTSLALNGVGDLFIFNPPTIIKIPADGSASTVTHIPGLVNPQAMAMDSNGAMYISDLGPTPTEADPNLAGFVLRVSPTGVVSMLSPPGYWMSPGLMTADGQGNIYVADEYQRGVFEVATWTGSFTTQLGTNFPTIGGDGGSDPINIAIDASGTFYFWDNIIDFFYGPAYAPTIVQSGPFGGNSENNEWQIPLYSFPIVINLNGVGAITLPFISAGGNQTMNTSANGRLYVVNGTGPGVFVVDRAEGYIPAQLFNPNIEFVGGTTQPFYIYNVGNENATFTDPKQTFTESGDGVGSFTYSSPSGGLTPCKPGTVIPPSGYCAINVTNTNGLKGPIVTDTLHFLTNAVNNNSVSFRISGTRTPTK
jgi:sugar lactone lactonase YvrE